MRASIIILSILLLFSCGQSKRNPTEAIPEQTVKDTIGRYYRAIDKDSLVKDLKLSMYNEPYDLRIVMYCLNDSAVVNKVIIPSDNSSHNALDYSHNYSASITLSKNNEIVLEKEITKELFKDSLDSRFYNECSLFAVDFDLVRTNRLYFNVKLGVPATEWMEVYNVAIFYQTEKKGQIDFLRIPAAQLF